MQKKRIGARWGLLALIWLLAGTCLLVLSGSTGSVLRSHGSLLSAVLAADESIEDPAAAFDRARRLFEEQSYRQAFELLRALREQHPGFEPSRTESYRLAAELRWESERPSGNRDELLSRARAFAQAHDDEHGVRVATELVRLGWSGSEEAMLERAAGYWEAKPAVDPQAVEGYLALLEATLANRGYVQLDATRVRIWRNLVRARAPRERMLELGRLLLSSNRATSYGYYHGGIPSTESQQLAWVEQIAHDVLAMEPDADLRAHAHLRLAEVAESRGRFEEAVDQARRARAIGVRESDAAGFAESLLRRIALPRLELSGAELFRPGSHLPFGFEWRNLRAWSWELRRLDAVEDLREIKAALEDPRAQPAHFYPYNAGELVRSGGLEDREELRAREQGTGGYVPRDSTLVLDPLPEGLYLLVARGEAADPGEAAELASRSPKRGSQAEPEHPLFVRKLVQVTQLGLMALPLPDGRIELWSQRADTGQPVGGLELKVWQWKVWRGRVERMTAMSVETDGDGRAFVPASFSDGRQFFIVGANRRGPVLYQSPLYAPEPYGPQLQNDWRGLVLSDRPLYRPSELVNLQVLARNAIAATRALELPGESEVELVIRAPDGSEFRRERHAFDENGAFETQFFLPERPALGVYHVMVDLGGDDSIYGSFRVDEYRLPEFRVDVALDTEQRYVTGDTLQVEVSAEYLFGGAVEGVAELVVRRRPYHWFWLPPMPCGWPRPADSMHWPGYRSSGEEVLRTELVLDDEGRTSLSIPTGAEPGQEEMRQEYVVEARVIDASRREETGQASVRVGPQELYAALAALRHVVLPGDEARVRLHVEDLMQRPAEIEGEWAIHVLDEKGQEILLREGEIVTDAQGDAILSFTPRKPGYYHLRFRAKDSRGELVTAETTLWCADPKDRTIVYGGTGLQLIAAEDAFVGDTARVLLVSEWPGQWVHLTHSFADEVRTEVFRVRGTTRLLEIPLDAAQRPRFHLRVMGSRDWRVHDASLEVQAPNPERALSIEMDFGEEEYRPGAQATLHLKVQDALGAPVRAPLTLAVVDAAILQLMPRPLPALQPLFQEFPVMRPPGITIAAQRFGGYAYFDENYQRPFEVDPDDWLGQEIRARKGELFVRGGRSGELSMHFDGAAVEGEAVMVDRKETMMPDAMPQAQMPVEEPQAGTGFAEPAKIRTDFRTTALWRTALWTDGDGEAEIEFRLPESLTEWNAFGLGLDAKGSVGSGETTVRTRQPLMVRLSHPRVFREGDRFRFTATVHNESAEDTPAVLTLEAEGLELEAAQDTVLVPAFGQSSVEWSAAVPEAAAGAAVYRDEESGRIEVQPRAVKLTVEARGRSESDAFQREVEIHPWGTPLRLVSATELRGGKGELRLELPGRRRDELSIATLNLSPSVLSACVDALPYLADYPYGCTEQTLSRFVPAVAVRAVARKLGVSSSRLDPELDDKIAEGLARIAAMQHADGGWGWWTQDATRAYMTAYALGSLAEARRYGVEVESTLLVRGRGRLRELLPGLESRPDDLAYALSALAAADQALHGDLREDETMQRLSAQLVKDRDRLSDYSRALLACYLHAAGRDDRGRLVLAKLTDTVEWDEKYSTAHWGKRYGYFRRSQGAVESTAFALRAYLLLAPEHPHVRGAARWLVANREGLRWDSTRATAHAIYALCEFAEGEGELDPDLTIVTRVAGEEMLRLKVTRQNLLDAGGSWPVDVAAFSSAGGRVELELQGSGSIYASLSFDTWTAEEDPAPSEHWLSVEREYLRLVPVRTLGGEVRLREEPLAAGDAVTSGDRIRVRLKLHAHRDLEYLELHDPRPAGCEPVQRLSGWTSARGLPGRMQAGLSGRREVRDEENVWFVPFVSEGEHLLEYELFAETPGFFRVPPARAGGMYLPDVNGSSRAFRLELDSE